MFWLDWIIIFIPIVMVIVAAFKSQKYSRGVADFLTANRVAGRYVVSIASGEATFGINADKGTMTRPFALCINLF